MQTICLKYVMFLLLLCSGVTARAQAPPNDDCSNAIFIPTGDGYTSGSFSSARVKLKDATVQLHESFPELQVYSALNMKSVWYRFEIKERHSITLELRQKDSLIPQNAVGFAVYHAKGCPPSPDDLDNGMAVLSKFGSATNTCMGTGTYLVQVCANNHASDSIWLSLTLGPASPALYDNAISAWKAGIVNGSATAYIDPTCLSTDSVTEACTNLGLDYQDYNKSFWGTFSTASQADMIAIDISYYADPQLDSSRTGYKLYEGDITKGIATLKLVDGCRVLLPPSSSPHVIIIPYTGFLKPNTAYSIQLFFHKSLEKQVQLDIISQGCDTSQSADPRHLDKRFQPGILQSGKSYKIKDQFSYNARTPLHACGSANPAYPVYMYDNGGSTVYDTLDLGLWSTFSISDTGALFIDPEILSCSGIVQSRGAFVRLFKGDITKDCNIPPFTDFFIANGNSICVLPGTYSIQLLGQTKGSLFNYPPYYQTVLGQKVELKLSFTKRLRQTSATFYKPSLAQDMGDITTALSTGPVKGMQDFAGSPEDSVTIDSVKISGHLCYRQFYISSPMLLRLKSVIPLRYVDFSFCLFSGKATDGLNTLKRIDKMYFDDNTYGPMYSPYNNGWRDYTDSSFFRSGCVALPAGWYTVAAFIHLDICTADGIAFNNITVQRFSNCTSTFNRPHKACLVNNGVPLEWKETGTAANHNTLTTYTFPPACSGCGSDLPLPVKTCRDETRVTYYVFNLSQECQLDIWYAGTESLLYALDVRKDSVHFSDSSRIVKKCGFTNGYCRVQPGTYTLVVFLAGKGVFAPTIRLQGIGHSQYDHASQACDMGYVPGNNTEVISPYDVMSCTTGSHITDPDSSIFAIVSAAHVQYIPYPVPQNLPIQENVSRNLWYTFTASGSADITVTVIDSGFSLQTQLFFNVYRSNEKGNLTFSQLRSTGRVDSTFRQGLSPVSRYNAFHNAYTYPKSDCDTARYYIVVDNGSNYSYTENTGRTVQVRVKAQQYNTTPKGDYCSNPVTASLNRTGSVTATASVNCHTAGEGFGEDGSNLGCLDDGRPYKTTWFRFTVGGTANYDLTFSLVSAISNYSASHIHYRVLYGSCDAMTPGPCVSDANSSFQLDCMAPGDYYIQVASPLDAAGTISITATATALKYPHCKPFSTFQPLANFRSHGGCNGSAISFENLSSAGADIRYRWDFSNGTGSSIKSPVVKYKSEQSVDTFRVTLWVTDSVHHTADSMTAPVYVFRDPVMLSAGNDTLLHCGDTLHLHAQCNYGSYADYEWSPADGLSDVYSTDPVFVMGWSDAHYVLTASLGGCILHDTINIIHTHHIAIAGYHLICDSPVTLSAPAGYTVYIWNQRIQGQTLTTDTAGLYQLTAYRGNNGCEDYDTFRVESLKTMRLKLGPDTTLCPGNTLKLHSGYADLHNTWSTGDTTERIIVNKAGTYWVNTGDSRCSLTDSIRVDYAMPSVQLGRDTVVCPEAGLVLDAGGRATAYHWNTGESSRRITVQRPGRYKVDAVKYGCVASDSILVSFLQDPQFSLGPDTFICDSSGSEIALDAGTEGTFSWYPGGQTSPSIRVGQAGTFAVQVKNDLGCVASDTIMVHQRCEPEVYVPNAFTPGTSGYGDNLNDEFKPTGRWVYSYRMWIYDRWGQQMFYTDQFGKGWNGQFKGTDVPENVYLWVIEYTGYRTHKFLSGTVQLMR